LAVAKDNQNVLFAVFNKKGCVNNCLELSQTVHPFPIADNLTGKMLTFQCNDERIGSTQSLPTINKVKDYTNHEHYSETIVPHFHKNQSIEPQTQTKSRKGQKDVTEI
jgi:hypothetical protein